MGTTADKLNKMLQSKAAIKAAISEKTGGDAGDVMSTYAEQIMSISGGGGGARKEVEEKDVHFYDYDGTLLYSYTVAEAQALTALPPLPEHKGLIADGWNYTLEEIKAENDMCEVGALYRTDDGKTRLYVSTPMDNFTVSLSYYQTTAKGTVIDWGDGTTETPSSSGNALPEHTYATAGDYMITITVTSGTIKLARASSSYCVMGLISNANRSRIATLRKIEVGDNVTELQGYCFYYCGCLRTITIPSATTLIGSYSFYYAYALKHVNFPRVASLAAYVTASCGAMLALSLPPTLTSTGNYAFSSCTALRRLALPNSVTNISTYIARENKAMVRVKLPKNLGTIGGYSFNTCYALPRIKAPAATTAIATNAFYGCYGVLEYDFTECTSVPSLASNALTGIATDTKIYVPAGLADDWKAASGWSTYASKIVGV